MSLVFLYNLYVQYVYTTLQSIVFWLASKQAQALY
jgi:hypothetical protein